MLGHAAMAALPISFRIQKGLNFCNAQSSNGHHRFTSMAVRVRASAYTRVPMDTPGAYQLIDNETGEKFIVWGGEENDPPDSPLPSQQVLSWKAVASKNKMSGHFQENVSSKVTRSFGRLKVQRVRDLSRRSQKKKQENKAFNNVEQNSDSTLLEISETGGTMENVTAGDNETYSRGADDHEIEQFPKHHSEERKGLVSDIGSGGSDVSSSRVAYNSFRGWGGRGPIHNYSSVEDVSPRRRNLSDKSSFFSRKSFKDLGCSDYMIDSLRALNFLRPSHIQAMAFGPVIERKSCIIADQSGSGKTLAYLLPLVQCLREEELQGLGKSVSESPRVVILVPTAELASQVLSICKLLSKSGVPFRSMVVTGGFRQRTQLENLRQELDVLIATPGRFLFLMKEGFLQLSNLKCAVLDEVDILFNDEDFELALQCLMNASPITAQYLFVTATLPIDIYNKLIEAFPDSNVIMGPGMHRTSAGLEEVVIDCSGDETTEKTPDTAFSNKKNALIQLIKENPVTKTIVFCNKIETCRKVENVLKRFDRKGSMIRVLPFHAALDQGSRLSNLKEFRNPQLKSGSLFLVCTDRASRGIDFAAVDHVVLFDFPRDPSEYVRRVGRTARGAGGKGKAYILVVGKQVSLARRIIERNRKGHPLHDVPSAYELMT